MKPLHSTPMQTTSVYYELAQKAVPCTINEKTRKLIRGIRHNLPPVPDHTYEYIPCKQKKDDE